MSALVESYSQIKPDFINYKSEQMLNGRWRIRKQPRSNLQGSSIDLQATGTTMVEWLIPAHTIFNLARSTIDYQVEIPGQPGVFTWAFDDSFEICSSIQFCNASGVYLTDLQYSNNYVNAVRKLDTNLVEFESNDSTSGLYRSQAKTDNYFPPGTALAVLPSWNV